MKSVGNKEGVGDIRSVVMTSRSVIDVSRDRWFVPYGSLRGRRSLAPIFPGARFSA